MEEWKIQKGKILLQRRVNLAEFVKKNSLEKKNIGKGFTQKKTMRKIASIPIEALLSLPPEVREAIMTDDRALKNFLKMNPHFLCCEGKI